MRLNHVTLPAHDYAASVAFYEALGLRLIVAAPPRYARFEAEGDSTLSIEVTEGGQAGTAEIFLHCDDVDAAVAAAAARGLHFDEPPATASYLWRRSGISDPSGNRIILFHAGDNQRYPPWRIDGKTADGERLC